MELDIFGLKIGGNDSSGRRPAESITHTYTLTRRQLEEELNLRGKITDMKVTETGELKILSVEKKDGD